ncbi:MAG TPA: DUF4340 domain-containing protein [Anaerolineae bacterium]
MKRTQLYLIVILVLQLALAGFTLWPRSTVSSSASTPLFAKLNASDVVALTVYDKPDSSLKLARQGGGWVLPAADNYPADSAKVDGFLTKVAGLKTNRLVTKTEASQARLQVAANQYQHRVDMQTASGTSQTLYVGSSSGAQATNVRAGDRPEVYLADTLTDADATAQAGTWINPTYLAITTTDTLNFTLKNANGEFSFTKDASGKWAMAGQAASETLNQDNVTTVTNVLTSLAMTAPLGKTAKPEYGLDHPLAVMTLTTKTGNKTYTLTVGALQKGADGANSYVVKSSESPYYVQVSEYTVKTLVDQKRDGFLQLPPTPTPGPAGAAAAGTPAPFQTIPAPKQ